MGQGIDENHLSHRGLPAGEGAVRGAYVQTQNSAPKNELRCVVQNELGSCRWLQVNLFLEDSFSYLMIFWRTHEILIILFTLCPCEEEEEAVACWWGILPHCAQTKQQACSLG